MPNQSSGVSSALADYAVYIIKSLLSYKDGEWKNYK